MLDLDSSQDLIEQKEIEFEDIIASEVFMINKRVVRSRIAQRVLEVRGS